MNTFSLSQRGETLRGMNQHARHGGAALLLAGFLTMLAGCGGNDSGSVSSATKANDTAAAAPSTSAQTASGGAVTNAANEAMVQINAVRASARKCGSVDFAPAAPVNANTKLEQAALRQANDMSRIALLTHTGSDNSSVADRIEAAGYSWRAVGENVALGYPSLADVIQGWVESPGHCANLMSPNFTEFGIASAGSGNEVYWALDFAAPRI